ncbi:MAG: NUDIX hydrolase, partial [Deltaproteobacteria bacterium]|nr:NUDIX hydrolase [Deltaproteobacteria bacterium]
SVDSRPEDDEIIEAFRISLEEALALIWSGELTDAKSALTLIHAARSLGRLA